jgi:hypothetical protein
MICKEITVVACQKGSEIINVHSPEILIIKVVLIQPLETAVVCVFVSQETALEGPFVLC